MTKKIIFNMEGRGGSYIFHWYIYMLGGLRNIPTNPTGIISSSCIPNTWEQNIEKYKDILNNLTKPYYITCINIDNLEQHQKESLNLISKDFIFIHKNEISIDDVIFNHYGEEIDYFCNDTNRNYTVNPKAYNFLRNLFLKNINVTNNTHKNKKYFISRNKSHLLEGNAGIKRRQIVNEAEVIDKFIKKYNFEIINLEDYNTEEKILIFNQADTIISPNSGALTFTLFAGPNTKIIELNVANPHQTKDQYSSQCIYLGIPYYFYETQKEDSLDNMSINVDEFIHFLKINKIL